MVSVLQRYGRTDRRTDVTCGQYRPMHALAVKTHITGSIERQRKVFIHAVHARLTNLQMSCWGSRPVGKLQKVHFWPKFRLGGDFSGVKY